MTEAVFIALERPHSFQGPRFASISLFPHCGSCRRQQLSAEEYEHFRRSGDMSGIWEAELRGDTYNLIRPLSIPEAVAMSDEEGVPF